LSGALSLKGQGMSTTAPAARAIALVEFKMKPKHDALTEKDVNFDQAEGPGLL